MTKKHPWAVLGFGFVLVALLAGAWSMSATNAVTVGPNPPLDVHLSYGNDSSQAVVTWRTASSATSRVEWGPSHGPPYRKTANGTDYTSPGGSFLHTVVLTGLVSQTTYHYRAGDQSMSSTFGERVFRSAPVAGSSASFSFVAAGDFGNASHAQVLAERMAAAGPDLATLLGDYYYSTSERTVESMWQVFQAFGQGAFVMTAVGNHEYAAPLATHCAYVNLPGNERTFAFTYGNTYFLSIDWGVDDATFTGGVDGSPSPCQGVSGIPAVREWVGARLAEANADPNIAWKVVFEHFPCYLTDFDKTRALCAGTAGSPGPIEDIFVNRGVDLVVTGHAHTMGRTHPVKYGVPVQTGNAYHNPQAPIYLVLGTGGNPRTSTCRTAAYVAMCRASVPTVGYGKFTVSGSTITYEFRDIDAGVVDSFVLTKSPTNDVAIARRGLWGYLKRLVGLQG